VQEVKLENSVLKRRTMLPFLVLKADNMMDLIIRILVFTIIVVLSLSREDLWLEVLFFSSSIFIASWNLTRTLWISAV
jgi:hypothetical protein